jgi:hypothetical protein
MPFMEMGRYVVVLTDRKTNAEIGRTSFLYLPVVNILLILSAVLVTGALVIIAFRVWKVTSAWLLVIPVFAGLVAAATDVREYGFGVLGVAQGVSLSAWLALMAVLRPGSRWRALVWGLLLTVVLSILIMAAYSGIGGFSGSSDLLTVVLGGGVLSALWFAPAAVAVLTLRREFSTNRFSTRIVLMWLLMVLGVILFTGSLMGVREALGIMVAALVVPLPFLMGLLLLVTLSRWCRERFVRALGLEDTGGMDKPDAPPRLKL